VAERQSYWNSSALGVGTLRAAGGREGLVQTGRLGLQRRPLQLHPLSQVKIDAARDVFGSLVTRSLGAFSRERGQVLVEYALVLAVIVISLVVAVASGGLADAVEAAISRVAEAL
jgi:Flp pilus assembly pilin Flp